MRMIKKTEVINGETFEIWEWNRGPTEDERKKMFKQMAKIMDRAIERKKLKDLEKLKQKV